MPNSLETAPRKRVVVTGLGAVTPLGLTARESWDNLLAGRTGISYQDIDRTSIKAYGRITGFNPEAALEGVANKKDHKRLSIPVQYGLSASIQALEDAGLFEGKKLSDNVDHNRVGIKMGSGIGGAPWLIDVHDRLMTGGRIGTMDSLLTQPERVASAPSLALDLKGPVGMVAAACASGNLGIIEGYKDIVMGDADIMLAGGTESTIYPEIITMFEKLRALATESDPEKVPFASKPFHRNRGGFVMGEGSGVLVLEDLNHALKRGARIYAEILGYGNTADAYHDTAPSGEGAIRAIKRTFLGNEKLMEKGVVYFNAHGTATPTGDMVEVNSIREVMGENENFAISSSKALTGHMIGGTAGAEAVFSVKTAETGIAPGTANLDDPDPEADGVNLVPNEPQVLNPHIVINNSFGFGGLNAVVGFSKFGA